MRRVAPAAFAFLTGISIAAVPPVTINEVLSSNVATLADEAGEYDDFIELYNAGSTAVDLGGWYLTDDPALPTRWMIPQGTTIAPHGFLLIWADGTPDQGPLHAPFLLDFDGEPLLLFHNNANGRALVNRVEVPSVISDNSWGRFPDGSANLMEFAHPTPRGPNDNSVPQGEPRVPPRIRINEFMASNATAFPDDRGRFGDWIELYNAEDVPVDLGGMHMTDDLANQSRWKIPAGTVILPKGFLIVWADDDGAQGPLHANFNLAAGGEEIGLFDTEDNKFQPIHTFAFGPQARDVSMGLIPNGKGAPRLLSSPSPGRSNHPIRHSNFWVLK